MTVDEISLDVYYIGMNRDSYLGDKYTYDRGAAFNLNLSIFDYIKWYNKIYTNGNEDQVRHVGWEFSVEADLKYIAPFYYHHSEHIMDDEGAGRKFPLRDYYGIRFYFTRTHKRPLWR